MDSWQTREPNTTGKPKFAGEDVEPEFGENELAKIVPEPTEDYEEQREDRPEMLKEDGFNPQARAIALVATLFYGDASRVKLDIEDVYIVWFCNTLQNWKALVSTNAKDDCYYEVTYNGDKKETYVDAYHKHVNVKVDDTTGICDMTVIDSFLF